MYRLEISSYAGTISVQSTEFEFLKDIQSATKTVVDQHHERANTPKVMPITFAKTIVKRSRGRPAGSRNKK